MLSEAGAWASLLGDLAVFPRAGLSSLGNMSKLEDKSDGAATQVENLKLADGSV